MSGTFSMSCLYHPPLSQLSHPKPVQCKAVPMSKLSASQVSQTLLLLSIISATSSVAAYEVPEHIRGCPGYEKLYKAHMKTFAAISMFICWKVS